MNFATEGEVNIYSEDSEDECNDPSRTVTSPKMITPELTTLVVNISTTQEPQEFATTITKVQLQNLGNKLFGKTLAFKPCFMGEILSLNDENKVNKINNNLQMLPNLILLRQKSKYIESEKKFKWMTS